MSEDRYNRPSKGTTDWHIPVNENFADIGVDVGTNESDITQLQSDIDDLLTQLEGKADTGHQHSGATLLPDALDGGVASNIDQPVTSLANIHISETHPDDSEYSPDLGTLYIHVE